MCRLCDFEVEEAHYCAACLEQKRKEGLEPRWVTSRVRYDELALTLAVLAWLGLVFLSPLALVVAWRFRKAPPGLTQRRNWRIPLALSLATLHLLALVLVVILIMVN
ncbi:hypothetical protein NXS98_06880 [Fontisphaera persica]|uniref:hypothetical protein n=1 Tax=Fontisphaera persica TaxID=2974023 RepID=UPI0024BFCB31|nr:hypothetical protein [Fontisphaera persica]WCJ60847.1 hypothetical protein NXS98_06880 [Fontisphaera persica]